MITVLFSAYCTHSSHKRICEGIIDLLETNGYKVSFFVTVHIWAYTELSCFYRWRFITVKGSSCEEAVGRYLYGSAHLFCLIRRISIGRDQYC